MGTYSFQCLKLSEGEKDWFSDTSIPLLLNMLELLALKVRMIYLFIYYYYYYYYYFFSSNVWHVISICRNNSNCILIFWSLTVSALWLPNVGILLSMISLGMTSRIYISAIKGLGISSQQFLIL